MVVVLPLVVVHRRASRRCRGRRAAAAADCCSVHAAAAGGAKPRPALHAAAQRPPARYVCSRRATPAIEGAPGHAGRRQAACQRGDSRDVRVQAVDPRACAPRPPAGSAGVIPKG
jgi:hypothetical protein